MDTWASIQEHKRNRENLRERIKRRRKEGQNILNQTVAGGIVFPNISDTNTENPPKTEFQHTAEFDSQTEEELQKYLSLPTLEFPLTISSITTSLNKVLQASNKNISEDIIEVLLQKQSAQLFITLDKVDNETNVINVDHKKLSAVVDSRKEKDAQRPSSSSNSSSKQNKDKSSKNERTRTLSKSKRIHHSDAKFKESDDDIEALLSIKTAKEQDSKKLSDEIQELLNTSSTKELILAKNFRSMGGSQVKEFCTHGTREECYRRKGHGYHCKKVHFKKILKPHTDEALGDCSFLNTCFHMDTCKYVHYEIDYYGTDLDSKRRKRKLIESKNDLLDDQHYISRKMIPPQWINCDVRYIDMSILGKFSVIMADPPWDIHMELPYGTMQDDEMRALRIQDLSDDGVMFLWVTGRAMELGRELFEIWGYKRCDELIWVKTNQLQRLIRTGRTGHWLNHGKEHCLVGIKGNPKGINRGLDCDVLVAEVRDTSHKPDEIYGIIERLSPGTRKLEIFGRMHNVQPNWVTLGNQLDGVHLTESDCVQAFKEKYPDGKVTNPKTKLSL